MLGQIDLHTGCSAGQFFGQIKRVDALAALEPVKADPAQDRVIARTAQDGVISSLAVDQVAAVFAVQDVGQQIAPDGGVLAGADDVFEANDLVRVFNTK